MLLNRLPLTWQDVHVAVLGSVAGPFGLFHRIPRENSGNALKTETKSKPVREIKQFYNAIQDSVFKTTDNRWLHKELGSKFREGLSFFSCCRGQLCMPKKAKRLTFITCRLLLCSLIVNYPVKKNIPKWITHKKIINLPETQPGKVFPHQQVFSCRLPTRALLWLVQ